MINLFVCVYIFTCFLKFISNDANKFSMPKTKFEINFVLQLLS